MTAAASEPEVVRLRLAAAGWQQEAAAHAARATAAGYQLNVVRADRDRLRARVTELEAQVANLRADVIRHGGMPDARHRSRVLCIFPGCDNDPQPDALVCHLHRKVRVASSGSFVDDTHLEGGHG